MPVASRRYPVASGGAVCVVATGCADGDLAVGTDRTVLRERRRRVVDLPWRWLHQVHGAQVVRVGAEDRTDGAPADAMVCVSPEVAVAVHTADCAPVALIGRTHGHLAAVHAGWRGLLAGVVEAAAAELRATGEQEVMAYVGPCISATHYEFSDAELAAVAARYGPAVRSRTGAGTPALDLRAGVAAALREAGVRDVEISPWCTAGEPDRFYSHRARGDTGRQAVVLWRTPAPGGAS